MGHDRHVRNDSSPDGIRRRVELPGQRHLTLRSMRPSDAPGMIALYAGLNDEDTYSRFFSGHAPTDSFVGRMAQVDERGGFGLVAVMEVPGGEPELVGEASCEPLPDGNGELGITVAERARGWLGPFLLDALVDEAAARGFRGIEAEVLVMNRRMISMLRRRGLAVLDHSEGPAIVRVVIATSGRVPRWPSPHDRPRLLIEVPGGNWRQHQEAEAAGFQVLACPGPSEHWSGCPALRGEPCPLVAGADVVVDALHGDEGQRLLESHRRLHRAVPVCVEVPPDRERETPEPQIRPGQDDAAVIGVLQRLVRMPPGGPPPEPAAAG
jgi:ribosomal protein S18 acetylase RimI-like enzyme